MVVFFRKNPKPVPQIIPKGEESRTYKLADVGSDANTFQAGQDQIIHAKIDQRYKDISAGYFGLVVTQIIVIKYPEPLQDKIDRPAENIADDCRPPKIPVQSGPKNGKSAVAGPEINAAANHILDELDQKFMLFEVFHGLCS